MPMMTTNVHKPPQPAKKLLIPTTMRVGRGRGSPGPSSPRKIDWNCGITTIMITATALIASKNTAGFASFDHVRIELVEYPRMTAHCGCKSRTLFDVLPHLGQHLLEILVLLLLREDVQALDQRQSGIDHDGELAREDRQVLRIDFAAAHQLRDSDLSTLLFHRSQSHLFATQDLPQRLSVVGDALARHDLVHPVATFKNVGWHFSALRFWVFRVRSQFSRWASVKVPTGSSGKSSLSPWSYSTRLSIGSGWHTGPGLGTVSFVYAGPPLD